MFFILFFLLQTVFTPGYVSLPTKRLHNQVGHNSLRKLQSVIDPAMDVGFPVPPSSIIASAVDRVSVLPNGDALDKQIMKIFFPALLSFLITPLTGSVDMFWVCLIITVILCTHFHFTYLGRMHEECCSSWRTRSSESNI